MQTKTVLIAGSNGYIGREVSIAFRQQGYTVYGMCRSMEKFKAARLIEEEIIPAIIDYSKPETIKPFVEKAGIIIECATTTPSKEIMETMITLAKSSGKCEDGSAKLYIQTTGFLQYQFEDYVLSESDANLITTVVRPSFIYGKSGGVVFDLLFFKHPVPGEKLNIAGNKNKVWPWCHISDLGALYVNIASEKQSLPKGQLFRGGVLNEEITYEKIMIEIAKCMGVEVKYEAPAEGVESVLAEIHVDAFDNSSALKIGWKPRFSCNPLDEMKLHYDSYLAWKQKQ